MYLPSVSISYFIDPPPPNVRSHLTRISFCNIGDIYHLYPISLSRDAARIEECVHIAISTLMEKATVYTTPILLKGGYWTARVCSVSLY